MDVIIHCGLNKTGTSALQNFWAGTEDKLKGCGIFYPQLGREYDAHHGWALDNIYSRFENFEALAKQTLCDAEHYGSILLSSEAFQDAGRVDLIQQSFPDCNVSAVFYIRNYIDYFSSWWAEDVQSSNICAHFRTYAIMKQRYLFPVLQRWVDSLGKDRLKVLYYSRNELFGRDIRIDFMKRVFDVDVDESWSMPDNLTNPSISGNLLFIKRLVNLFLVPEDFAALRDEFEILSQIKSGFSGSVEVSPDAIADISAQYSADRDAIYREFGIYLSIERDENVCISSRNAKNLREDFVRIEQYALQNGFVLSKYLENIKSAVCNDFQH